MADYEEMNKDELQEELSKRELPVSGNKDDLVARLELNDAEAEEAAGGGDDAPEAPEGVIDTEEAATPETTVEAGPDADPEAVAEASADPDQQVERGDFIRSGGASDKGGRGSLTDPGNLETDRGRLASDPGQGASTSDTAPSNQGTDATGAEVSARSAEARGGGDELDAVKVSKGSLGHLGPQANPDALSPEVAGYVILPDGRRQPVEYVD